MSVLAALALLPPLPVVGTEPSSDVTADLKAYYADGNKPPPWEAAVKRLSAAGAAERDSAAVYLRALLAQTAKDERSGAAPWRATPFWGEGPENPARNLRKAIAASFADGKPPVAALPVMRWYLDEETIPSFQDAVMKGLAQMDGKDADDLRIELAGKPHPNAAVVVAALTQLAAGKRGLPADRLAALCQHYRPSVRAAARKLNAKRGGPEPAPFDAAGAMRAPAVRKLMGEVAALIVEAPPARSPFVVVTTTYFDKNGVKKGDSDDRGWRLKAEGDEVEILTPYGWRESYHKQAKPAPGERGEGSFTRTVEEVKIEDEVRRVEQIREKDDRDFQLSERGGLTGQFQGRGAGLYEIMLAQWLDATNRPELAARILLPALDTVYRDADLVRIACEGLGEVYGKQMLVAFVGDRDYPKAERLAKLLADKFPETRFHEYGVRLAGELPKRRDDFVKLRLPTPKEWADLKPTLTRERQIDYLCERMRLLNCFQWGQPGGFFYSEKQYAEPCGLAREASWGLNRGKTEVINPVVELAGEIDGFHARGEAASKGLGLTLADAPRLAPYLKDDWFLLIVSFWRDFHPDRTLESSRPLFAGLIDRLAKRDLCRVETWDKMTDAERDKEIRRIADWAKANAGKSENELLLQAVEEALKDGKTWYQVEDQANRLVELKEKKALPLFLRFLDAGSANEFNREAILSLCRDLDPAAVQETADKYLKDKSMGVRLQAALILFEGKDRARGRQLVGDILENADRSTLTGSALIEAVDALFKEGSKESRRAAARLLTDPRSLAGFDMFERIRLIRSFADEKLPDGFRFYLPLLDVESKDLGPVSWGQPVREVFADEITDRLAPNDPDVRRIKKEFPKTTDRIPALKKWLKERIDDPRPIPEGGE